MPIYRRRNSPYWWADYRDAAGKRQRVSTACTDRRAAEAVLREFERRARIPGHAAASEAATLSDLIGAFLLDGCGDLRPATLGIYEEKGGQLRRLIGHIASASLHVDHVAAYREARRGEDASDHTIHKEFVVLRRALRHANQRGGWERDPRSVIPRHKAEYVPRERCLTQAEYRELWAALIEHRRLWLAVAVYTGGRYSEVEGLDWSDVRWDEGMVWIGGTKTDRSRRFVPLFGELRALLEPLRFEDGRPRTGPVVQHWLKSPQDLKRAAARITRARRVADPDAPEFAPLSPNDLRRTFCTWGSDAGIPEADMVAYMGHGSDAMVRKVYRRRKPESYRAVADLMPRIVTEPRVPHVCHEVRHTAGSAGKPEARRRRKS